MLDDSFDELTTYACAMKLINFVKHGAWANRNRTATLCYGPYLYRNLVERFFNKIKHYRRVAARCDTRTANGLAFIELTSTRLRLRVDESTDYICAASID